MNQNRQTVFDALKDLDIPFHVYDHPPLIQCPFNSGGVPRYGTNLSDKLSLR